MMKKPIASKVVAKPIGEHASRETRAYHEAGHAIARIACGGTFSRVAIDPEGVTDGVCDAEGTVLEQQLMTCAAGLAATAIHRKQPAVTSAMIRQGGAQDLQLAFELCRERRPEEDAADLFSRSCDTAVEYLRSVWPFVEKIAAALLKHGELTFSDVQSLCGLTANGERA